MGTNIVNELQKHKSALVNWWITLQKKGSVNNPNYYIYLGAYKDAIESYKEIRPINSSVCLDSDFTFSGEDKVYLVISEKTKLDGEEINSFMKRMKNNPL